MHTRRRIPLTFNPIKVLFLPDVFFNIKQRNFNFQSYQGSIFTWKHNVLWCHQPSSFNPIKVLFLHQLIPGDFVFPGTFNPIKVLFLLFSNHILFLSRQCFQSYQGSIFTMEILAILGRENIFFQSYQGSIFTEILSQLRIIRKTFNPIKVLFLQFMRKVTARNLITFNPIKVLFLHGMQLSRWET